MFVSKTCTNSLPLLQGVLFSRGRRILFADADGASNFSDLALLQRAMDKLLKLPSANGHAIVVGSRAHMVNSDAVVKVRAGSLENCFERWLTSLRGWKTAEFLEKLVDESVSHLFTHTWRPRCKRHSMRFQGTFSRLTLSLFLPPAR